MKKTLAKPVKKAVKKAIPVKKAAKKSASKKPMPTESWTVVVKALARVSTEIEVEASSEEEAIELVDALVNRGNIDASFFEVDEVTNYYESSDAYRSS